MKLPIKSTFSWNIKWNDYILFALILFMSRVDGTRQCLLSEPVDRELHDDDSGLPAGRTQLLLEWVGRWPRCGHDLLDHHHRFPDINDDDGETFDHHQNRIDDAGVDDDRGIYSIHRVERHLGPSKIYLTMKLIVKKKKCNLFQFST